MEEMGGIYEPRGKTDKLLYSSFFAGAVATVVVVAVFFHSTSSLAPLGLRHDTNYVLKIGNSFASDVYLLSKEEDQFRPLTFKATDGSSSTPVDAVPGPDGSWYFLKAESAVPLVANVYIHRKDGSEQKLTHSQTMKYGLTRNAAGDMLAYQSQVVASAKELVTRTEWKITTISIVDSKEREIAKGVKPSFVPSGNDVIYEGQGGLYLYNAQNNVAQLALPSSSSRLFAVDQTEKIVSVINETTGNIDQFAILANHTLSFTKSTTLVGHPTAMASAGDIMTYSVGTRSGAEEATVFVLTHEGKNRVVKSTEKKLQYARIESLLPYEK